MTPLEKFSHKLTIENQIVWKFQRLMEIYRNMHTFAFQVLQECGSWTSRYGALKMFFLTPTRIMFFSCIAGVYYFIMLSELRGS